MDFFKRALFFTAGFFLASAFFASSYGSYFQSQGSIESRACEIAHQQDTLLVGKVTDTLAVEMSYLRNDLQSLTNIVGELKSTLSATADKSRSTTDELEEISDISSPEDIGALKYSDSFDEQVPEFIEPIFPEQFVELR